jgi:hypothetical protein
MKDGRLSSSWSLNRAPVRSSVADDLTLLATPVIQAQPNRPSLVVTMHMMAMIERRNKRGLDDEALALYFL